MNKLVFIFLPFLTFISYVISYSGFTILPYLYIAIWVLFWKVYSFRYSMIFYLLVLLIDSDISKYGVLENSSFITIYTTYIFGKSIFVLWTFFVFLLLIFQYITKKGFLVSKKIFPFLILLLLSIFMSFTNDSFVLSYFISDLGYFINFFVGILIVLLFINNEKKVIIFFKMFLSIILTKAIIISVDSYLMSQNSFFNTYSPETGSYLLSIAIIYSFLMISKNKFFYSFSISTMLLFVILTASRARIAIISLSLLIAIVFTKRFKAIMLFSIFLILIALLVSLWNENVINYFLWKVTTFMPSSGDESGKVSSMSSMVRLIEFLNIIHLHLDKLYTLFFGVGLGGYFTSEYVSYPFNMYGTSSYPDLWIDIDKFYKPHGSWLFILLKFGLFGFLIIFYTVIALSYSILKQAMTNFEFTEYSSIIVAIASFLPFLFLVNFSSKLQVFTGVMFAIIATAKTTLKEVP